MDKKEFFAQLRKGLSGLPKADIEEHLTFYGEMIDDRMEEGLSEEDGVAAIGTVDHIVTQAVAYTPLTKIAKERILPKKRPATWEIVLLVLGCPIWLSLGITAIAVLLSLYIALWSVIISLWAVFASLAACSFAAIITGIILACSNNVLTGIAVIGTGITSAGLSIFMFFGCKAATRGALILTKKFAVWVKNCFIKKEKA